MESFKDRKDMVSRKKMLQLQKFKNKLINDIVNNY